jgi:hypothetical protein
MSIKNREKKAMIKKTNGVPFLCVLCAEGGHHRNISTIPEGRVRRIEKGEVAAEAKFILGLLANSAPKGTALNLAQDVSPGYSPCNSASLAGTAETAGYGFSRPCGTGLGTVVLTQIPNPSSHADAVRHHCLNLSSTLIAQQRLRQQHVYQPAWNRLRRQGSFCR